MRTAIVVFVVARAAAFVPAPPEVAALRLKETLDERGFVRIPGAEFRALLRWKGAKEEDLQLIESGAVHADVATDEGAMAFRQSAAHRLVATGPATFVPAQRPAVTKIPAKEVASAAAAIRDDAIPTVTDYHAPATSAADAAHRGCPAQERAYAGGCGAGENVVEVEAAEYIDPIERRVKGLTHEATNKDEAKQQGKGEEMHGE